MTANEIRQKFVSFFKNKDHSAIPAASLVPEDDPSVLFTTAGMQQFKRYYTQPEEAPAKNVVTIQPCFRTSDIEQVGDKTHLTFFEMLGNFSFGEYFKKGAIDYAWEFLTGKEWLEIDPKKITCSIFAGERDLPRDDGSAQILQDKNLPFKELDREENFWGPIGNEGPCGPTVEFYLDGIEVWNLVFNEYYKTADGKFKPLKIKGVDTGMGLERILAVLNDKDDIFETELFKPAIQKIQDLSGKKYSDFSQEFRIITDHIKAATFGLSAGIVPSNVERGYIIRRLIRRAIVKAWTLEIKENFTSQIVEEIFSIYPDYFKETKNILDQFDQEENKFRKTLERGLKIFQSPGGFGAAVFGGAPFGALIPQKLTGKKLFDLYQTYGFPLELSLEIAKEKGMRIDDTVLKEFNTELKRHKELSRTASAGMFRGGLAEMDEKAIRNHTATHLLQAALREVLGDHIQQKGSHITEERLRFDFSHPKALTQDEIQKIETLVNEKIKAGLPVNKKEMTLEEAKKAGAIALFDGRYGEKVTVYSINNFSKEVCRGPHVKNTSEIGSFKIIKEESSAAGIRRIKAVTQ